MSISNTSNLNEGIPTPCYQEPGTLWKDIYSTLGYISFSLTIGANPDRLFLLGILHLLANLVAKDLVPVNLSAGDWKLSTQCFECGVRHGLIVLRDGHLKEEEHVQNCSCSQKNTSLLTGDCLNVSFYPYSWLFVDIERNEDK